MNNEIIKHGRSLICDLEIESYNDVFLSDFFEDTVIDFEYLHCDELYIGLNNLRRNDNLTWKISVPIKCIENYNLFETACQDISNHCTFLISYYIPNIEYTDPEVTILIDKDMSIYDAFKYAISKKNSIIDYVDSIENQKISKLVKASILDKLPIYSRAMKKIELELSNFITDELSNDKKIISIVSRVKTIESIQEKIYRKNICQFDVFEQFDDIAGVRCTCEFLSDVYDVLEYLKRNPLLTILSIEDTINFPLDTGYRGIHIIGNTTVYYRNLVYDNIKVEIQLRTTFQNAWSMKTHQLTYKQDSIPEEISITMRMMSDALKTADDEAQKIKNSLNSHINP
jgi:putative GTP pyrophosphokinase